MRRQLAAALTILSISLCSRAADAQSTLANAVQALTAQACRSLNGLALPELGDISAEWVDGEATTPGSDAADANEPIVLPAFCRVRGLVEPAIRFEVWLPHPQDWSGRFLGIGASGFGGSVDHAALRRAVARGYAAASTDTGHTAASYAWLADEPRLRDFGYRAIFEMTAKAEAIIAAYFGRSADYRYFNGCSTGGGQGLMEALRFPEDYDGIVAGAPVNSLLDTQSTLVWSAQAMQPFASSLGDNGRSLLSAVNAAAIAQCDTLDGVLDGVLEDPRRCNFDPSRLQCSVGRTAGCLSPAQVAAVRQVYAGPRSTGSPTSAGLANSVVASAGVAGTAPNAIALPGFAIGSELQWSFAANAGPDAQTLEFFDRAIVRDPLWDWRRFDLMAAETQGREDIAWMLDATSADLSDFRANGGKLIVYQGWNDGYRSPEATIAYYESIEADPANAPAGGRAQDFARLFMVPGMAHCGGGIGTDQFDAQTVIEDWVERGIAPDRIEATRVEAGAVTRSRPLCPYPQLARYRGSGNSDRSGSFVCDI
jgi:feruloyl esterase